MAIQLTDAILTFIVLIAIIVLAPIIFEFQSMISSAADPLSSLIFTLIVPLFIVALLISVGVSARRRV
jgi:tellurite resistance protein TehA-like permease